MYPYFEIINFVGQLLLFVPRKVERVVSGDPRTKKALNAMAKVRKELQVLQRSSLCKILFDLDMTEPDKVNKILNSLPFN